MLCVSWHHFELLSMQCYCIVEHLEEKANCQFKDRLVSLGWCCAGEMGSSEEQQYCPRLSIFLDSLTLMVVALGGIKPNNKTVQYNTIQYADTEL